MVTKNKEVRGRYPYETGETYHIMNLSIGGYEIFRKNSEYLRFIDSMKYYQFNNTEESFSHYISRQSVQNKGLFSSIKMTYKYHHRKVDIIAYCLMSTHFHILCRQLVPNGIVNFLNQTLNGYTQYFNSRHNRKGPLWIDRTKKVKIQDEKHMDIETHYIHLNPTTAYLVHKPELWPFSSYREYINLAPKKDCFCKKFLNKRNWRTYKKSVEDRIEFQREQSRRKKTIS